MYKHLFTTLIMTLLSFYSLALPPAPSAAEPGMTPIDTLNYSTDADFQANWIASENAAKGGVLSYGAQKIAKLPCPFFTTTRARAFWDYNQDMDLSNASGLSFDMYIENVNNIGNFTFYIMTEGGEYYWYIWKEAFKADNKW